MTTVKQDLLDFTEHAWGRLRDRLGRLSDHEYHWEPAPGCWGVRAAGQGEWRADGGVLLSEQAPLTTIAWRIDHLADGLAADRCATWIGVEPEGTPLPAEPSLATSAGGVARLRAAVERFRGYVAAAGEEALRTPMGPQAGPYSEADGAAFVLHMLDELVHHGAEISLLRDLYRTLVTDGAEDGGPVDELLAACLTGGEAGIAAIQRADTGVIEALRRAEPHLAVRTAELGRWAVAERLLALGFDAEGPGRYSVLHLAAGAGRLDMVERLLEDGSDPDRHDARFDATPLGWAEFFGRAEVIAYLRPLTTAS